MGDANTQPLYSGLATKGNLIASIPTAYPEGIVSTDKVEAIPPHSISPDNMRKLFFKPLNKHSTRDHVLTCLEKFGRVEYLRVPFSNKKRKNLGYGFVMFESKQLSDLLCRHQIKTKIDDKIVGFSKFDMLKFKCKKKDSESSSSAEEMGLNIGLPSLKSLSAPLGLQSQAGLLSHFLKPTNSKFYSLERRMPVTKYKYNLERLGMKAIRDKKSCFSLQKLRSTTTAL